MSAVPRPVVSGALALSAVLLALVALLALVDRPAAASPRGHRATPATASSHPWSTDGCSMVPDRGWWVHRGVPGRFDFGHACVHHDGCYRGHWASRRGCDGTFLDDMAASCRSLHPRNPWTRGSCLALADLYHLGVRILGASAYRRGSHEVPISEGG
jgi:hypothetical protein